MTRVTRRVADICTTIFGIPLAYNVAHDRARCLRLLAVRQGAPGAAGGLHPGPAGLQALPAHRGRPAAPDTGDPWPTSRKPGRTRCRVSGRVGATQSRALLRLWRAVPGRLHAVRPPRLAHQATDRRGLGLGRSTPADAGGDRALRSGVCQLSRHPYRQPRAPWGTAATVPRPARWLTHKSARLVGGAGRSLSGSPVAPAAGWSSLPRTHQVAPA